MRSALSLTTYLFSRTTKATLPATVESYRGIEISFSEFRPQRVSKVQLRVRHVPEQKVADPMLTAGSNKQIRGFHAGK